MSKSKQVTNCKQPNMDSKYRILDAASSLIAERGISQATTRAIALKADVQPPDLYRLFGDKHSLLQAVAEHVLTKYVDKKMRKPSSGDPIIDLENGWDTHISFGLAHPEIFMLIQAERINKIPSPALRKGHAALGSLINEIAKVGRLKVSEERAVNLIKSSATGTVLTLLSQDTEKRDQGLSNAAKQTIISSIVNEVRNPKINTVNQIATHLNASLGSTKIFTQGELGFLKELLARLSSDT
jgi:AcrR family transcriptional regulator